MKIRTVVLWGIILVVIDQIIKIIVNSYFLECRFDIIPSLFEFSPTFNTKHSYFKVLLHKYFDVDMGLLTLTVYFHKHMIISGIKFRLGTTFTPLRST
jgi:lipoprotein signal peptidase